MPNENLTNTQSVEQDGAYGIRVEPPSSFDFKKTSDWSKWRKRFERFASISGLRGKSEIQQIDAFLYIMGDESENIMMQFPVKPTTLEMMIQAFNNYFEPRANIIFERYLFNTRIQEEGESVDAFITSLHTLAENCQYGNLKDELIRDRIVVGVKDVGVSTQMQLRADLTLKDATFISKQNEMQRKQSKIMNTERGVTEFEVNKLNKNYEKKSCFNCGGSFPHSDVCPAKDVVCYNCNRRGHFSKLCRSKKQSRNLKVRAVEMNESDVKNEHSDNLWG